VSRLPVDRLTLNKAIVGIAKPVIDAALERIAPQHAVTLLAIKAKADESVAEAEQQTQGY
jgi:hypothetical protein